MGDRGRTEKVGIAAEKDELECHRSMRQVPHVLKPLSEEEVHEQSKIITSDKMKKKVHRKREERERERECMISVSVQNIKHHLTRVLIHIRNKEKTWKSFSRHFNFAHKYM